MIGRFGPPTSPENASRSGAAPVESLSTTAGGAQHVPGIVGSRSSGLSPAPAARGTARAGTAAASLRHPPWCRAARRWPLSQALRLALLQPLVEELGVLLLDVRGVAQHPVAEVDGGRGGVNRPAEAVLHQRTAGCRCGRCGRGRAPRHRSKSRRNGRLRFLRSASLRRPWLSPQSSRYRLPSGLHQVHRPGDLPAAPQNVSFIDPPQREW